MTYNFLYWGFPVSGRFVPALPPYSLAALQPWAKCQFLAPDYIVQDRAMQGMAAIWARPIIKGQSWLICSRAVKTLKHVKLFR